MPHICISESGQHWFRYAGLLSIGPFREILIKIQNFHSQKCLWKYRLWNGDNMVQVGDKLRWKKHWWHKPLYVWDAYHQPLVNEGLPIIIPHNTKGQTDINTILLFSSTIAMPLRWRHDGCDSISNHQPHDCLLNRLFRRRSKKTSKLRVTGLCVGNSPGTGEFPAQMASNAENVSIWWLHHALSMTPCQQPSTLMIFQSIF